MRGDIDTGLIRTFQAVVDSGSVTKAALPLNLTQGAISQQIKRLEDLGGKPLFARTGRKLVLTQDGHALIDPATRFLHANDQLWAALREPAFQGEVRFGTPYDIMGSYTPAILRGFSKAFPAVRVSLVCEDTLVLLAKLKAGAIDLALTTELGCGKGGETLRRDRLVWAGARDGEAHTKDPLPVSLGAEACVFRPIAIAALRKARREWLPICEVSNMEPVRATLEADLAVAPLLSHSIPDSLDVLPHTARLPRLPLFRINLYEGRQSNPAVRAFADRARACVSQAG